MEHAYILARRQPITPEHLPHHVRSSRRARRRCSSPRRRKRTPHAASRRAARDAARDRDGAHPARAGEAQRQQARRRRRARHQPQDALQQAQPARRKSGSKRARSARSPTRRRGSFSSIPRLRVGLRRWPTQCNRHRTTHAPIHAHDAEPPHDVRGRHERFRAAAQDDAPINQRAKRTWRAKFADAFRGMKIGVRGHSSFFVHFFFAALVIATAMALRCGWEHWSILILCIGFVLVAEMFNSAIETLFTRPRREDQGPQLPGPRHLRRRRPPGEHLRRDPRRHRSDPPPRPAPGLEVDVGRVVE